ncbi:hypothetical protein R3W88_008146 [Solanum pinnatisectum]|uniref:DDE Tnp4 domain-containing protein n=1 Tax=Solanum pinnatisectum TaxID=50273 RepID=A0AAV9M733_9SOLN|nr:hypothetical protein R3W88_008146 [Solanum pinnatisectum]
MEDLDFTISPHLSDLLDEEDEELEQCRRGQNEKEWMTLCRIAGKYILMHYEKYLFKEPCHLNEKCGLKPTCGMSIHEMLGIFLMTCAHGAGNRMIQDIFQHSGETVHRHFHSVLNAVSKLARDIIKPYLNYNDGVGAHKPCNERYLPFFKDCIEALDGTHFKARLPQGQQIPYIGRKGYPTQNILAVVDFNIHIFGEALCRSELNFPRPLGNKCYLVDARYAHKKGYMAPYKGDNVRYHLPDFCRGATRQLRDPRGHIEKFNYMHTSSRNIVECTFVVWKERWSILRGHRTYYYGHSQLYLKKCNVDDAFQTAENERYMPLVDSEFGTSSSTNNK